MSSSDRTTFDARDSGTKTVFDVTSDGRGGHSHALPPDLANKYQIIEYIDSGTQADVYRCRPADGSRDVAIKLYGTRTQPLVADVIRKIEDADPNHILPTRFGESYGQQWEIQEWITGKTLSALSKPGEQLELGKIVEIVGELAGALAYAHSLDLVHRDIKPSNILVRRKKPLDLVLSDFGIARELIAGTELGTTTHTPGYAAPEALVGELHSFTLDWWSLGITLFEVATGRHPFMDDDGRRWTDVKIHSYLVTDDVDTSRIRDERVRLLLRGLLTYDRDDRWTNEQVQDWLRGGSPPVVDRTIGTSPPVKDWKFIFLGNEYRSPAALGNAMLESWDETATFLADRSRRVSLQNAMDGTVYAAQVEIEFNRYRDDRLTVDGLVFQLGHLLSSAGPIRYRGVQLTNEGFGGIARKAAAGDTDAGEWIEKLLENRILHLTDADDDHSLFVEIDERLHSLKEEEAEIVSSAVEEQAKWFATQRIEVPTAARTDIPAVVSAQNVRIQGQMLLSVLNPKYDSVLIERATSLTSEKGWLRNFGRREVDAKSVPLRCYIVDILSESFKADSRAVESARIAARRDTANASLRRNGIAVVAMMIVIMIAWALNEYGRYRSPEDSFAAIIISLLIFAVAALAGMWASDYYLGLPERTYLALLVPIAVAIGWRALNSNYLFWGVPFLFGAAAYTAAAYMTRAEIAESLPGPWPARLTAEWTWSEDTKKRSQIQGFLEMLALVSAPIVLMAMLWEATWGSQLQLRTLVFDTISAYEITRNLFTIFVEDRVFGLKGVWWTIPAGLAVAIMLLWDKDRYPGTQLEAIILSIGILGITTSVFLLWPLYALLICLAILIIFGAITVAVFVGMIVALMEGSSSK